MILRSLECRFLTIALCDAAEPWQLGSQDAATPMMQGIIDLHHDIFFFLILILVFVSRMLVRALWHFNEQTNPIPQRIVHGTTIEIIRTIFPSVILLFIAIPSFALLYSMDGVLVDPAITIKAIGHQWYRSAPLNEGDLSATKCTDQVLSEVIDFLIDIFVPLFSDSEDDASSISESDSDSDSGGSSDEEDLIDEIESESDEEVIEALLERTGLKRKREEELGLNESSSEDDSDEDD